MPPPINRFQICWALALLGGAAWAQAPAATPRPFFAQPAASAAPRDVKLIEKPFEALSNQEPNEKGKLALGISPEKWKHAETENFILHYRRVTEAQKVAREVEYNLWYVATQLGATKERYSRRSHVFIFEDDEEWKKFKGLLGPGGLSWASSFAFGDELFLNVRGSGGGGFDSQLLAHETTHAVVARLFSGRRWPLWLNEGFAEYMGGASVAARKGQSTKRFQRTLGAAEMPLAKLEATNVYPMDPLEIGQLYQSSEKFVRFLMNEFPKDRFVKFIDAVLEDKGMEKAVIEVYPDKVKDWDSFLRRYERFTK